MGRIRAVFVVALLGACGNTIELSPIGQQQNASDAGADGSDPGETGNGSRPGENPPDASAPPRDAAPDVSINPGACAPITETFSEPINPAWIAPNGFTELDVTDSPAPPYGSAHGTTNGSFGQFLEHDGNMTCGVDVSGILRVRHAKPVDVTFIHVSMSGGTLEIAYNGLGTPELDVFTTPSGGMPNLQKIVSSSDLTTFTDFHLIIALNGDVTLVVAKAAIYGPGAPTTLNVGAMTSAPTVSVGAYVGTGNVTSETYDVDVDDLSTVP